MAETLMRRRPETARIAPALLTGRGPLAAVVDMGGTDTRVAPFQNGQLVGEPVKFSTPSRYAAVPGLLRDATITALGGRRPDAVGFVIAGEVSRDGSTLDSAGQLQEMGYTGQPIADDAARAMGLRESSNLIMLNDCVGGAQSELTVRREELRVGPAGQLGPGKDGVFATLSTGFGAAIYTGEGWLVPDAAGHRYYKSGAKCGDGQEGHAEAHISGSGQLKKFGKRSEDIPVYQPGTTNLTPEWQEIKSDFHSVVDMTLHAYGDAGLQIDRVSFTGSVALKGPTMLEDLQAHLDRRAKSDEGPKVDVVRAKHKEGGLVGAGEAAILTYEGNRPFVVYHADGINAIKGLRASR